MSHYFDEGFLDTAEAAAAAEAEAAEAEAEAEKELEDKEYATGATVAFQPSCELMHVYLNNTHIGSVPCSQEDWNDEFFGQAIMEIVQIACCEGIAKGNTFGLAGLKVKSHKRVTEDEISGVPII